MSKTTAFCRDFAHQKSSTSKKAHINSKTLRSEWYNAKLKPFFLIFLSKFQKVTCLKTQSILYECFINEISMNIDEPSPDLMKNQ
ncbi:hypothetical protein BpHYR1_029131 [Brachionus plicatilis]|uniref:Uncharacterized protein n=1 Tax=Brachionus plicatilis TaxID=10195 RepID=A0A3M7RDX5_BRAPC|nr:hypothetical protein BpHYR1_029131 [Brachionus plicatilis]